jgi:uncharacterized coiled-coil protein SlyX
MEKQIKDLEDAILFQSQLIDLLIEQIHELRADVAASRAAVRRLLKNNEVSENDILKLDDATHYAVLKHLKKQYATVLSQLKRGIPPSDEEHDPSRPSSN